MSRAWAGLMSWNSSTIRCRSGAWTRAKVLLSESASTARVMHWLCVSTW
jgi:hypothetical protein